jgi:glycosyltransferase involved in cell wall biosynthesis
MNPLPRLLLVGPLPSDADVIGGTKVSFAALVDELGRSGRFAISVHDTTRRRAGRGPLRPALDDLRQLGGLLWRLARPGRRPDAVLFNTSSGGALLAGPLVWTVCRLRGLPLAVRVFGGDLDRFLERAPAPLRALARRTVLRSELLLLQTRALCERLDAWNVRQLPTSRDLRRREPFLRAEARRFVFVGQLRREKGAAEAVRAAASLPPGASLTLYGPAMPGFDLSPLLADSPCRFGGPLGPGEVQRVLEQHDALVFPSYHGGEGLPGVVVEALQLGLPVIAADWRSIPELVEHEQSGLLVSPRDADGLAAAMARLSRDPGLFQRLRAGAQRAGERHRSDRWTNQLIGWLEELCGLPARDPGAPRPLEEAA